MEKIEVIKKQPATGEYVYFDIKYGPMEEEMGDRMVAAVKIAAARRQDIKDMHQDLKGSVDAMHQDLKETGVYAQGLKGSIDAMHQDMNQNFKEMAERYDVISAELLKTRKELETAVDNLVKVVQKFLEKPG